MTTLFGLSIRLELLFLYIAEALACFTAVYIALEWGPASGALEERGNVAAFAAVLALSVGLVLSVSGLYEPSARLRLRRTLTGAAIIVLLQLLLAWLIEPPVPLWSGLPGVLCGLVVAIMLTRFGFVAATRAGVLKRRRVALVRGPGGGAAAEHGLGWSEPDVGPFDVALTASSTGALAPERLRESRVWAVVAADLETVPPATRGAWEEAGVRVFSEAEFREWRLNRVDTANLPENWLDTARVAREGRLETAIRRGVDLAVSLALLVLTAPLLLLTVAAVKLDTPGPVFYKQERVGRGGRVFTLYKFRSMVVDAEAGGTPIWASRRDPRVTRVGRLLRLTRIDEIPQILNVLRGDMALVGPRPERPAFVEQLGRLIPRYHDRACIKPGITGWAQVNYPYGASVEDARMKLAYDLYYIRRRSLFLDAVILLSTVRVVLFQEGAR